MTPNGCLYRGRFDEIAGLYKSVTLIRHEKTKLNMVDPALSRVSPSRRNLQC